MGIMTPAGSHVTVQQDIAGNIKARVSASDITADSEQIIEVSGSVGTNDNDQIYESEDVSNYNLFTFTSTNAVDIFVKTNSTDSYTANPVALIDLTSTTPATRVVVSANAKQYCLVGKYYQIKVLQNGASAANIKGTHSIGVPPA